MEKEPSWSTALTTSLRVAFGLLLITLALIAFSQILLSILSKIADQDRGAWIGFWGNIVGGVLGLVGGASAAVAAIYVLKKQFNKDDSKRASEKYDVLKVLARDLLIAHKISEQRLSKALDAIRSRNFQTAFFQIRPIPFPALPLDTSILPHIASVAFDLAVGFREIESKVRISKETLKLIDDRLWGPSKAKPDAEFSHWALTSLSIDLANILMAHSSFAYGLLNAASASSVTLDNAEDVEKFADHLSELSKQFHAEFELLVSEQWPGLEF